MKKVILIIAIILTIPNFASSWDGYDWDSGSYIEIDKGNLVRPGRDIEIYDYDKSEYKDVKVESVNRYGGTVEVEVYEHSTGEYRTFDMDSR